MTKKKRTFEFGDVVAACWFRAVAVFIVFAAIATLTDAKLAAESDLPLLQDGSPRTDFLSAVYKTCLERQRKLPENTSLTTPELGQYCLCYGRALADIISASEFEAITRGGATPASFLQKTA